MSPILREADNAEVAACGSTPEKALSDGIRMSDTCYTGLYRDKYVCMFGVVPLWDPAECSVGVGAIWLLGTNQLQDNPRSFIKVSPGWIRMFHRRWAVLTNMVDVRNSLHLDWLDHMGFVYGDIQLQGPQKLPFVQMTHYATTEAKETVECATPTQSPSDSQ